MVISFVKKYNRLLSACCHVGDLSLSISCRVGEYFFCLSFFVCELTFGQLSVGELSHNAINSLTLCCFNNEHKRPFPLVFIIWFEWWTRLSFDLRHTVKKHIMK